MPGRFKRVLNGACFRPAEAVMNGNRLIASLTVVLLYIASASAQLTYTFLSVPNANTTLNGINNNGVISGNYVSNTGAGSFTWDNGIFTYFSISGCSYSAAIGINDSNVVVGYCYTTGTNRVGYIYDGQTTTFVQYSNVPYTELFGINNAGLAVGYEAPDTADYTGLTFDGTEFHTFIVPGLNSWSTFAYGVNNLGDIVGTVDTNGLNQAFLRRNGQYRKFIPSGSDTSGAIGINDNGIMLGSYGKLGAPGGCFLLNTKTGKLKTFTITGTGFDGAACTGINNAGVIVGFVINSDTGEYKGFYTSPMTDADSQ